MIPLLLALLDGKPEFMEMAEEKPGSSKDVIKSTVLHFAVQKGATSEFLKVLAQRISQSYPDLLDDYHDKDGYTPLHALIRSNRGTNDNIKAYIEALIEPRRHEREERGGGLYATNNQEGGKTALNYAIDKAVSIEKKSEQVSNIQQPHPKLFNHCSPMSYRIIHCRAVKALLDLDAGANRLVDMDLKNEEGESITPLMHVDSKVSIGI